MSRNRLLLLSGTSVPPTGTGGYVNGCQFIKTDAANGQCATWINIGTNSSALFIPVGTVTGYGIAVAGGPYDCTTGSTTQTISLLGQAVPSDIAFVGHSVSDDSDTISAATVTTAKNYITITASADPLTAHDYVYAVARNKANPTWDIFAAGTHTCVGGGVAEAITVTGASASDIALVSYAVTDDTDVIAKAAVTTNTLTVTMSADPTTTHSLHYMILRPRGSFKPSHYIYAAGTQTTVADTGAPYTNAITVTGATSSDVAITGWNTTDDTDTILQSVLTSNTLTCTLSANPGTTHALAYMVLRAY